MRMRIGAALAALALVPSPASAAGGGTTVTACSALTTICVAASATNATVCAKVDGVEAWQCTAVLVASATPAHGARPPGTGGSVTWTGSATCEFRKRADGFNDHWTGWSACPGGYTRSGIDNRGWPAGGPAYGGSLVFQWESLVNYETAFATDCVEVRVAVTTHAVASSNAFGVPLEHTAANAAQPTAGVSVSGVCEGGSPY